MGEVIKFPKPGLAQKNRGKTLCGSGFHRWEIVQEKRFDVRRGKLVTLYRCARCGASKTDAR
jgi:hypothetical protein